MLPQESITLLMPTLNRHDFVVRALNYYSSVGFKGYVCVGDSSDAAAVKKTKQAIEPLQDKLNIIYSACPAPPSSQGRDPLGTPGEGICLKQLIELVPTKYAAPAPDDDFQIPNGLYRCAEFLESHDDYSAAHGTRIGIELADSGAYSGILSANYVRQPALEEPTAAQRFSAYMRHTISPAYSVLRTDSMRRIFEDFGPGQMRYIGSELIPSSMIAILGKVKELDCLSTVHQYNPDRVWNLDVFGMYSMIMHPLWTQTAHGFRDGATSAIAAVDQIDGSEAEAVFDREFWNLTSKLLHWQLEKKYGSELHSGRSKIEQKFLDAAKKVPFATSLVRRMRESNGHDDVASRYETSVTLDSLMKPSSPFHADFMPVYNTVVGH